MNDSCPAIPCARRHSRATPDRRLAATLLAGALTAWACVSAPSIAADFETRLPAIDVGELEIDAKLARPRDARPGHAEGRSWVTEIEFGVSRWWSPAIEGEWTQAPAPGLPSGFQATTFENRFAFAEPGAWWADVGLFAEYERTAAAGEPAYLRLGPTLRKDIGPVSNVVNLFAVREIGGESHRPVRLSYALQSRWLLDESFQPGIEVFGQSVSRGRNPGEGARAGPVIFGVFDVADRKDLRYELGYLREIQSPAPRGTLKILVGYEQRF